MKAELNSCLILYPQVTYMHTFEILINNDLHTCNKKYTHALSISTKHLIQFGMKGSITYSNALVVKYMTIKFMYVNQQSNYFLPKPGVWQVCTLNPTVQHLYQLTSPAALKIQVKFSHAVQGSQIPYFCR